MLSINQNEKRVFRPLEIKSSSAEDGTVVVDIFNTGSSIVKEAGIWISIAKNIGEALRPPDFDKFIDYNDLIRWGNESISQSTYGGLVYKKGTEEIYFSSSRGNLAKNKIVIGDIPPGESIEVTLKLEVPASVSSRRMYIAINVE